MLVPGDPKGRTRMRVEHMTVCVSVRVRQLAVDVRISTRLPVPFEILSGIWM